MRLVSQLLVLLLALGGVVRTSSVWCIGPDGHSAIETIGAGCCESLGTTHAPDGLVHAGAACDGCTDIPLVRGASLPRTDDGAAHAAVSPPLGVATRLHVAAEATAVQPRAAASAAPRSPREHRTTVHRC